METNRSTTLVFGAVTLERHRLLSNEVRRFDTPQEIAVIGTAQGPTTLRSASDIWQLQPRAAVLLLACSDFELSSETGCTALIVRGPASLAEGLDLHREVEEPAFIPERSALIGPFSAFASQTLNSNRRSFTPLTSYYVERLLQEMFQGLLAELTLIEDIPVDANDSYTRAMITLAARYSDPSLTSAEIAQAANISRRQLEREFAKHGTTIRTELRKLRVREAQKMLADPEYSMLTVDQIARHLGFSNGSSLSRAMSDSGLGTPISLRPS
ncbi:helix-turn-helix domain-containing protein [Pseudoclavibacter sp. CFCC 13796]|uniref:helix-turn-helix domain-containing protein n=1 Tax=Pseudoclavibacter sp. CFCC 13796 TaxID=2615179 RepID=UPI00178795CC|nr:helix-turn-helix domain-containing protein [Pseudoclavibacter sp. CFCC 13796]